MASGPFIRQEQSSVLITDDLRALLDLRESDTHYLVRTLSGATLMRRKSDVRFAWELLEGIMDDGVSTSEDLKRERDWEFAHDGRKFGVPQAQ